MFKKILTYLTLGTICSIMIGVPLASANLGGAFSGPIAAITGAFSATGTITGSQFISTNLGAVGFTFSDAPTVGIYEPAAGRIALGKSTNALIDVNTNTSSVVTVGTWTFTGSAPDIITGSNEDFTITPNGTGRVVIAGGTPVNLNGDIFHMNAPTSITTGTCTAEALNTGATEFKGIVTATCTAQTWIVVFTTTYTRAPTCVVIPLNAAAVADVGTVYATTTTTLTATVTTATTNGTWAYQCVE